MGKKRKIEIELSVDTRSGAVSLKKFDGNITKLGNSVRLAEGKTKKGFRGMKSSAAFSLGKLGVAGGIAGVVFGLNQMTSAITETGAAFESRMARVGALTQATEREMQALNAQARQLGATTVFSASEAADGMQFLAMAGFETNEIVTAMPGLLAQAAAGQIDLGTAADITSNVLSGFNLNAAESGSVADVLTKASISSNTTIEGLGQSMAFVAPVAASLGLNIEELTAATGIMGDAGIQATRAGTALRGSLLQLASPSKAQAGIMKELGFELQNSDGSTKSLVEIIRSLENSTRSMSAAQRTATLSTLVGQEAASGFTALIARGSGELERFTGELERAGGTAERVATQQLDTFEGTLRLLDSAMDDLKITLFETFNDELRGVIEFGISLIQDFKDDIAALFKFVIVNGGAAFQTFQAIWEVVMSNFGTILFNFMTSFGDMVRNGVQFAGTAFSQFVGFLKEQLGNLQTLFEGIGDVLIGAFTLDRDRFDEGLEGIKESLLQGVSDMLDLGEELGSEFASTLKENLALIFEGVDTAAIQEAIDKFISLQEARDQVDTGGGSTELPEGDDRPPILNRLQSVADAQAALTETTGEMISRRVKAQESELDSQERIIKGKLAGIEREKAAKEALLKADEASIAQSIASADTSIQTSADVAISVVASVRQVIQAKIGEAIAKAIASIPFPANLVLGGAAAGGINLLFNKLVPQFAGGVTDFSGGAALVGERGPEIVTLPSRSNVITNENTQKLLASVSDTGSNDNSMVVRALDAQTRAMSEMLEQLGVDISNRPSIARIDPHDFKDDYNRFQRQQSFIGNASE